MSDPRLSQSPRALRDSTNDPEEFAIGSVPKDFYPDRPKSDPVNDSA